MRWKTKALVQTVFSRVPRGEALNYLCQRRVLKSLPIDGVIFADLVASGRRHMANLARHAMAPLDQGRFFEFGAGRDLVVPLVLWSEGVNHQLLIDIRRLAQPDLVQDAMRRLGALGVPRELPAQTTSANKDLAGILRPLGIEYAAPCDGRRTGRADGSVDYVTSTSTLEHIPPADIRLILRELRRILRPGGVASLCIDYQDHYSYSDPSISVYNFLQFEDADWAKWSPSLQFQNRLRHSDHVAILRDEGFVVLEEDRVEGSPEDLEMLGGMSLATPFRDRDPRDLAVHSAFVTVTPAA